MDRLALREHVRVLAAGRRRGLQPLDRRGIRAVGGDEEEGEDIHVVNKSALGMHLVR